MEQVEKTRSELALERKQRQILDPRSLVVLIGAGSVPWETFVNVRELDRKLNRLVRNVGFTVPLDQAMQAVEAARKLASELWDRIKQVTPALFDFNPERWSELNESYEQKQALISRRNSAVFIPRLDETARIMMGFKVLRRRRIELSSAGDLNGVEKIARIFREFDERIRTLSETIAPGK